MLAAAPQTSGSAERPGRLKYPDYSGRTGCREDVGMPMPRPQKICPIAPVSLPYPLLGWHNPGAIQVFCHGIEPTPMVSVLHSPPPPGRGEPPCLGRISRMVRNAAVGRGSGGEIAPKLRSDGSAPLLLYLCSCVSSPLGARVVLEGGLTRMLRRERPGDSKVQSVSVE